MQITKDIIAGSVFLIIAVFLSQTAGGSHPDSAEASVYSPHEVADSLLFEGKTDSAKHIYREILDRNEADTVALLHLGRIAFLNKDWGEVKDYFDKLLKVSPNNLYAFYYRGIAFRETGKFKALLLRKWDWNKSEDNFEKVLERDSLFKDVLYQYARLMRYRGRYEEAIEMGHLQLNLRPDLIEPRVKLYRLYRYFITHRNLDEVVTWLNQQTTDYARYFTGEKLRREGKINKADSLFRDMLGDSLHMPSQPVYLSLARIAYQLENTEDAQHYYWQAVESIVNHVQADLVFEDLKYILTDQELAIYRAFATPESKIDFFHDLWISRDPTPAASINVRLAEHYRRLLYAEKNYEYDGFRTWFADPDVLGYFEYPEVRYLNHEFNDKGLIYIRHGEPDERIATLGEDVPVNESWLYYQTGNFPRLTFHFLTAKSGNDWRLAPLVDNPAFLEDRLTWGNIYYRLLRADDLERLQYEQEMIQLNQQAVKVGMSTDRHSWSEDFRTFPIPLALDMFRGTEGKTTMELTFSLNLETIKELLDNPSEDIDITRGIAIFDTHFQSITQQLNDYTIRFAREEEFVEYHQFQMEAGEILLALHARLDGYPVLGGWKMIKKIPDFSGSGLKISDVQLANEVSYTEKSTGFVKNSLTVYPVADHVFSLEVPIQVYFEIYGLTSDIQGNTIFEIEYDLKNVQGKRKNLTNLFGLFGGEKNRSVTIQSEHQGNNELSREHLAIDLSNLDAGEYQITVKVFDKNSGETAKRQEILNIIE